MTQTAPARRPTRRDGWTPHRQRVFLRTLAITGSVSAACNSAGMSRAAAYALRDRPAGAAFRAGWDRAQAECHQEALGAAMDKAINGALVPVMRRGRIVAHRHRFDDRMMMQALRYCDDRDMGGVAEEELVALLAQLHDIDDDSGEEDMVCTDRASASCQLSAG